MSKHFFSSGEVFHILCTLLSRNSIGEGGVNAQDAALDITKADELLFKYYGFNSDFTLLETSSENRYGSGPNEIMVKQNPQE